MSEIRALFKPVYLPTQDIYNHPVINGQFIIDSENGAQYVDINGVREVLSKVVFTTYAELVRLKEDEDLIPGRYYCMTDYRTIYESNGVILGRDGDPAVSVLEPLYLQAIDKEILDEGNVMSQIYPQDLLTYSLSNNTVNYTNASSSKGVILERRDPINGIQANFDWRSIKVAVKQVKVKNKAYTYGKANNIQPMTILIGNGTEMSADRIFVYGKNKPAGHTFSLRNQDVFATTIDALENMVTTLPSVTVPVFSSDDNSKVVNESIKDLILTSENLVYKPVFNVSNINTVKNVDLRSSYPLELPNIYFESSSIENVKVVGSDICVKASNVIDVSINGNNTTISLTGSLTNTMFSIRDSIVSIDGLIDDSNFSLTNSYINGLVNITGSIVTGFKSILGQFLIPNNILDYQMVVKDSNIILTQSKLYSSVDSSIHVIDAVLNTNISGTGNIESSHLNMKFFNSRETSHFFNLELTNTSQIEGKLSISSKVIDKAGTIVIGDVNVLYNDLVNQDKYKVPTFVNRVVDNEHTTWIGFINDFGISDQFKVTGIVDYAKKITLVPN